MPYKVKFDWLTAVIVIIAVYLLYTLVTSPESCDHKTENYTKKHKKSVHHKKRECKNDKKPLAEIQNNNAKSYEKNVRK